MVVVDTGACATGAAGMKADAVKIGCLFLFIGSRVVRASAAASTTGMAGRSLALDICVRARDDGQNDSPDTIDRCGTARWGGA